MNSINIINVSELSDEENWSLFRKLALSERPPDEYENLEEIGREIVKKCKGLPLATITIGRLLQFKKSKEQWQRVLGSELWKAKNVEKGYLGLEKDDQNVEIIGEEYSDYLVTRSLLQANGSYKYKMHDIVHDFAQFLGNNECLSVEVYGVEDPLANSSHDKVRHLMLTLNGIGTSFLESTWVEKLTGLRRLSGFVIRGGGDHDNKACSFEGLKNLNRLEGSLTVRGLGNLTDVSDGKLTEVLKNEEKLHQLNLEFDKSEEGERLRDDDELILKTLQLPPNLEDLSIWYYRGNTFPSTWTTLTKLKVLRLRVCSNCKHLHHLGNLPLLELLDLMAMSSVKKVDDNFWGIESETSSSSSLCVHFPKLKDFRFWYTREWEEWDCKVEEFMPCLASLRIVLCPKLKALPDNLLQRTTLKRLDFSQSPILTERYNKETGEDWPKISHIPYIEIDCNRVQHEQ
ncbi:putative disease resistance protein RGA3 [Mangifera indica]|uniref:putative disease resistance protein RGA3 n=1 Tax=Mangifera indica TaxID=29780 RepID=UPI001CF9C51F|nr:putative disease resistance protein RGA3 [Mangifera indica]